MGLPKKIELLNEGVEGYGIIVEWNTKRGCSGYISSDIQNQNILKEFVETKKNTDTIFMNCVLQKYDAENRNGRFYPKVLLEREDQTYQTLIKEGRALGESDHPSDSTISLKRDKLSHRVVKTWWEGNVLQGILEILTSKKYHEDGTITCQADFIADLLRRGVRIGISSRGIGSLKNISGKNTVQDDYELICYDLVTTPSTIGAYLYPDTSIKINESENNEIKNNNEPINKINKGLDDFLL